MKIAELVKQSSRKGRKLIVVKNTETVRTHQVGNSQLLKIAELVKQARRKRRKLIVVKTT